MPDSTSIDVRVRYAECDAQSVAHHSTYPVWLEMARIELLRVSGPSYRECEAQGVFFVVVRLEVRYRSPARYDDVITIHVRAENVGHVKIDHVYEIRRGDQLLAEARTTIACVDRTGRPTAMPEGFGR